MTKEDARLVALITGTVAVVVVVVFLLTGTSVGGKAPADWDVNEACVRHRGVQQVTSSYGYTVAVVCRDGVYVSNPYD